MAVGEAGEYEQYGPFGSWGDHAGQCSIVILDGLSEEIPASLRVGGELTILSKNDGEVFEDLSNIENGIEFIRPHPSVEDTAVRDLHRAFRRFHTALPLTEAERHWFFRDSHRQSPPPVDACVPETLLGVVEEITSGGLKQVVQGREMVRRMAAWRRESDEFADQGTLDEARQALGDIATTLVTDANWPEKHEDIRVQLKGSA